MGPLGNEPLTQHALSSGSGRRCEWEGVCLGSLLAPASQEAVCKQGLVTLSSPPAGSPGLLYLKPECMLF